MASRFPWISLRTALNVLPVIQAKLPVIPAKLTVNPLVVNSLVRPDVRRVCFVVSSVQ
jgi:hypothetical protein